MKLDFGEKRQDVTNVKTKEGFRFEATKCSALPFLDCTVQLNTRDMVFKRLYSGVRLLAAGWLDGGRSGSCSRMTHYKHDATVEITLKLLCCVLFTL